MKNELRKQELVSCQAEILTAKKTKKELPRLQVINNRAKI